VKTGPKGIALTGRLARVLFAAVAGCGSTSAQDIKVFDANTYPAGVQKVLQSARDECKAEGGGEVQFAADTVRTLDLTGAGRDDYIDESPFYRREHDETDSCYRRFRDRRAAATGVPCLFSTNLSVPHRSAHPAIWRRQRDGHNGTTVC
jgi:hypothetical protein